MTMIEIYKLGATNIREIAASNLHLGDDASTLSSSVVCVGDEIDSFDDNTLRGHGTQVVQERLTASVCGCIERVNKLVTVRALHRRYKAEVGDVVIGRVTEIVSKRWRIDLNSMQESVLLLSAVSLPGGAQRRRTADDELNMRSVFEEGDLISAEVQSIQQDGSVMLHTRSTKYGKLRWGKAVQVPAQLVKRQRRHFQHLEESDVDIILGCNGIVWVTRHVEPRSDEDEQPKEELSNCEMLTPKDRENIARASQSLLVLASLGFSINGDSIGRVIATSISHQVQPKYMLNAPFLTLVADSESVWRQEVAEGAIG